MIRLTILFITTMIIFSSVINSFTSNSVIAKTEMKSQLPCLYRYTGSHKYSSSRDSNISKINVINNNSSIYVNKSADVSLSQSLLHSFVVDKLLLEAKAKKNKSTIVIEECGNLSLSDAKVSDEFKADNVLNAKMHDKQLNSFINADQSIIKKAIGENSDLPAVLVGLVVAYLAVLISVAIAIFSEKKEFEVLDRNVILDHIVKAKLLLFYLFLTFVPLLFWNGSILSVRLLEIFFWILGIICMTGILINSYYWMKGNKFQLRFCYLKKLQNKQDMEEVWRSVWQTENINHQNELKFFNIFYSVIDMLLGKDYNNIIVATKLLDDFNNFLKNRSAGFLTLSEKTFVVILKWHFELWQKEYRYLYQDKEIEKWSVYSQLSGTVNSIFKHAIILTLKERNPYNFFKNLKEHIEKYEKIIESDHFYIDYLFDTFHKEFFNNIYDSPERFNIWRHYYPAEWKITKSNLQSSKNQISKITLAKFLEWVAPKIWEGIDEKDFALDDVSRNIFPELDPILWASILIFIYSSYDHDLVRSVIEKKWNFGFFGRVHVSSVSEKGDVANSFRKDVLNTIDMSFLLFREQFSKENLVNYIKSLEELSYPEDSNEERKRIQLLNLFSNMLSFSK